MIQLHTQCRTLQHYISFPRPYFVAITYTFIYDIKSRIHHFVFKFKELQRCAYLLKRWRIKEKILFYLYLYVIHFWCSSFLWVDANFHLLSFLLLREFPLVSVVKLVWRCWILSFYLCITLWFSLSNLNKNFAG